MNGAEKGFRRRRAYVSLFGTTQIHLRHPLIIAWWSASFPGFGHLLLSKYLRGCILFLWEIIINLFARLNEAMVYTFTGKFRLAEEVLQPQWALLYIPVYLYAIWDSYRTSVDLNKIYILAERENAPIPGFKIGAMEINYLDKRKPWLAAMWSFFMPGMGQLYIHRIIIAFFVLTWWIVLAYFSHAIEAVFHLLNGEFVKAEKVIETRWLMFMPSIYLFAVYDAYVNTVENNKLFETELANWIKKRYQSERFLLPE